MKRFSKADNEFLHKVYETYTTDARAGRVMAGGLSRYIRRIERNLQAYVEFFNSGYMMCSCPRCHGIPATSKSWKCPKEVLLKKLKGRK